MKRALGDRISKGDLLISADISSIEQLNKRNRGEDRTDK